MQSRFPPTRGQIERRSRRMVAPSVPRYQSVERADGRFESAWMHEELRPTGSLERDPAAASGMPAIYEHGCSGREDHWLAVDQRTGR